MQYFQKLVVNMAGIKAQHDNGVTTSLSMSYAHNSATTGTITFNHNGWVSDNIAGVKQYNTVLTWTPTSGVTVQKNGTTITSGSAAANIKTTDTITVTRTAGLAVTFTLTDSAKYVKAKSIKGSLFTSSTGGTSYGDNHYLIGIAQFVTLKNVLAVSGSSGTQQGTASQTLVGNARQINPSATFTYIQTDNHSDTMFSNYMNIQDLSITFHNTYGTTSITGNTTIYARKTISGASAPANQNFVFTLAKSDENGNGIAWPSGLTVTVTGGTWNETNKTVTVSRSTAGAGDIDFQIAISGLAGSSSSATLHYFTLVETSGGGTGWANAANEFLFRVSVPTSGGTSNVNGYKTRTSSSASWPGSFTTSTILGSSTTNRAVYTNTYTPPVITPDPAVIKINLRKTSPPIPALYLTTNRLCLHYMIRTQTEIRVRRGLRLQRREPPQTSPRS